MAIKYHFQGNIEGEVAVCTLPGTEYKEMTIPAHVCTEKNNVISILKRDYLKMEKENKINLIKWENES